jgi:hypothetical protein
MMRIVVGLLTLVTSIIIIVQTEENTTLFADFAALNVIASLDNLVKPQTLNPKPHPLHPRCQAR